VSTEAESGPPLSTPLFHHVHQNSPDPRAAIAAFQKLFPALARVTIGGFEGLQIADGASILFTKVTAPPPTQPQSAFLRHVFSVGDIRELVGHLHSIGIDIRPLYTIDGTTVEVSSETYQNGMTRTAYEEASKGNTHATSQERRLHHLLGT
jgi:hypothetical protein